MLSAPLTFAASNVASGFLSLVAAQDDLCGSQMAKDKDMTKKKTKMKSEMKTKTKMKMKLVVDKGIFSGMPGTSWDTQPWHQRQNGVGYK